MFANIAKQVDTINEHFFIIYGEQMTGQVIDKSKLDKNFITVNKLNEATHWINSKINNVSTIHIHFLSDEVINFLSNYDIAQKKIVWYFWGSDAYSLPEVYTKIKQYRTDYVREFLGKCKQVFKPLASKSTKLNFIKKIDYVAHYSIDDYNLLKTLLKKDAVFKYFTYGVIDYILDFEATVLGNDIILGNSASQNNHHLYTIKKKIPTGINKKIYCPLSYGGNNKYVEQVIKAGKKKFKNNFIPLTELINTNIYHKELLPKAEFALMPHNRSQAWGNIMQLLWQGSKVFMFSSNNLFKFLKEKGFLIFEINKQSFSELSNLKIDVELNKKLLLKHFSLITLTNTYKEVLSL